jgi:exodeoxyribonuclease V
MVQPDLGTVLLKYFPFEPTPGQQVLVDKLSRFVFSDDERSAFVLKGYAGTGKTTIIGALVKALPEVCMKCVLLAPTGRAAKVLSNHSGQQALTIHKKIYFRRGAADGLGSFVLQQNVHANTLFIVDESSMIPDGGSLSNFRESSLLEDLFEYVYSGSNCRLLFIGDTAQLPPVGLDMSPALDPVHLRKSFFLSVDSVELKDVVRQAGSSGILANATAVRDMINKEEETFPKLDVKGYKDITRITGAELEDALNYSYSKFGPEGTMVICRSNKRANIFNQQIRARIRWQEDEISTGDYLMVVKNNYHWLPPESKAGFIANGDIVELQKVGSIREMHGFRFADVRLRLIDYPDEPELETKIILDTLTSEAPALTPEQGRILYESVTADYMDIGDKSKRLKKVKADPFFNALQVKFAYAVTCHKAQGGQWESVFVEQGYLTEEMVNREFLRWLYTGVTRATEKLYLVNFNKEFFE